MAEFVYDPYGAVIGQRTYGVGGHPPLKAGHRGLFAESLTVGTVGMPDENLGDPIGTVVAWVDGRVLVPNERVVYHMRNRAYDPGPSGATAGRFLQRDPNASGAVLYGGGGGLGSHGAAPVAVVTGLDLAGHVGDGVNTYGYLGGSMRGESDPTGLFSVAEIAGHAATVVVSGLRGGLDAVVSQYSNHQLADLDWAMDWSQQDDWHTRGSNRWVADAWEEGLINGFTDGLAEVIDELSFGTVGVGDEGLVFAGKGGGKGKKASGGGLTNADRAAIRRANARSEMTYSEAKKITAGHNSRIQAHKLVEKRHAKSFKGYDIDDAPAVVLSRAEHQRVSNMLYQKLPPGGKKHTTDKIRAAYQEVYKAIGKPKWFQRANTYMKKIK